MSARMKNVSSDYLQEFAFAHGTHVEADATHLFTRYAGITYRAQLEQVKG